MNAGLLLCENGCASMPLFFIIPVWILCTFCGVVLLLFAKFRGLGIYVIAVSTAATILSVCLSTLVLLIAVRLPQGWAGQWAGILVVGMYILSIGVGGLAGGLLGFLLVRRLLRRRNSTADFADR